MCTPQPDWELPPDLQHQPILFRTAEAKKPQYDFRPYNIAYLHLEKWASDQDWQDSDDDGEMFSLTDFSSADFDHILIESHQRQKSASGPSVGEIRHVSDSESQQPSTRLEQFACSALLQRRFSSYRPVLACDSSGWHALAFSYFEVLLHSRSKIEVEEEICRIQSLNNLLKTAGQYEIGLIKDKINKTINLLKDLLSFQDRSLNTASVLLLRRFNEPGVSDAIIYHFRLIASSWLAARTATYDQYIPEGLTIETYRNRWLTASHREIDALGMRLLVDALLRPLHGVEFDVISIEEDDITTRYIYPKISACLNGVDSTEGAWIYLLHRSDHYDILYRDDPVSVKRNKKDFGLVTSSTGPFEPHYQVFDLSDKHSTALAPNHFDTISLLSSLCLSESGMNSFLSTDVLNRPIHARTANIRKTFETQRPSLDLTGLTEIVGLCETQEQQNTTTPEDQVQTKEEAESVPASIMIANTKVFQPAIDNADLSGKCADNVQIPQLDDAINSLSGAEQIIQDKPPNLALSSLIEESLSSDDESDDDYEIEFEADELSNKGETGKFFQDNSGTLWNHYDKKSSVNSFLSTVKNELSNCLMKEFWDIANQTSMTNIRNHGNSPASSSPSVENGGAPTKQSSRFSYGKRPLDDGNDDPSEQDRDRDSKKPRSASTLPDISSGSPNFACPYRKHDPRKYNVNQWAKCALTQQTSVHRVKGHLYRYHRIYQCKRCKNVFKTQQELDAHILVLQGCIVQELDPQQPVEGITDELEKRLKCRKKSYSGQTEVERWQEIYQLLFPNEITPDPHFEPVQDLEKDTSQASSSLDLEAYLRREVPRVFQFLLESDIGNALHAIEEQLKNRLLDLLEQAQNHALMTYHSNCNSRDGTTRIPIMSPPTESENEPQYQYNSIGNPVSSGTVETSASYQFPPSQSESEMTIHPETHDHQHHHASFDSGCYCYDDNPSSSSHPAFVGMPMPMPMTMPVPMPMPMPSSSSRSETWQSDHDPSIHQIRPMDPPNHEAFDQWNQHQ